MGNQRRSDEPNLGAVMTCIISPTRMILVKDGRRNALWKLPGGGIETGDKDVIAAAIRENAEETGIKLEREEVIPCAEQRRTEEGVYYPYFYLAQVSEEKLDTRLEIADENGQPIRVAAFNRGEVPTMVDLLERHRSFIRAVEKVVV